MHHFSSTVVISLSKRIRYGSAHLVGAYLAVQLGGGHQKSFCFWGLLGFGVGWGGGLARMGRAPVSGEIAGGDNVWDIIPLSEEQDHQLSKAFKEADWLSTHWVGGEGGRFRNCERWGARSYMFFTLFGY